MITDVPPRRGIGGHMGACNVMQRIVNSSKPLVRTAGKRISGKDLILTQGLIAVGWLPSCAHFYPSANLA